jgi:hypothetical protein
LPFLHFPWCMAQRSLHAITEVYYRSMSCFAIVSQHMAPLVVLRFPAHSGPICTMWFRTQNVTKTGHIDRSHPHSIEHDTQSTNIAYLISKQAVPYQIRGGTCCPRVSTRKSRYFANSSKNYPETMKAATFSTVQQPCSNPHLSMLLKNSFFISSLKFTINYY